MKVTTDLHPGVIALDHRIREREEALRISAAPKDYAGQAAKIEAEIRALQERLAMVRRHEAEQASVIAEREKAVADLRVLREKAVADDRIASAVWMNLLLERGQKKS